MFIKCSKFLSSSLNKECCKLFSTQVKQQLKDNYKTQSWQIHSYGEISDLQLHSTRIPLIRDPNELLIHVEGASVNPIDVYMVGGYGRALLQFPRNFENELPLIVGRDFCGTVLQKGHNVQDAFEIGDKVYGFIPIHKRGSFSHIITAQKEHICHKPKHLSCTESSSLVYASMTAWSALNLFANSWSSLKHKKVLVLGASGGVGTAAVQLLKAQGCDVFATCATDAIPLVRSLGADEVIDYKKNDYLQDVALGGPYHIILDCAKFQADNIPSFINYNTYVGLNSPLLKYTDKYGVVSGLLASTNTLIKSNLKKPGRIVKWAFFVPSGCGFKFIDKLIKEEKIKPIVHKEFNFDEIPEALCEVNSGHLRGKVVVNFEN